MTDNTLYYDDLDEDASSVTKIKQNKRSGKCVKTRKTILDEPVKPIIDDSDMSYLHQSPG